MTIITQKTAFYVGLIEQLPRHFYFGSQGCFVFGNDAQRHANKGAQQMADTPPGLPCTLIQDNSRPKSPTKVETKKKLQQFTVSRWLIMDGGESGNEKKENFKVKITFNMKCQYNYQPLVA